MPCDVGNGDSNAFHKVSFMTGIKVPYIPARVSSPTFSEWLALTQRQPCDLSHPDSPRVLRV
jgi:hypothetical protein